MSPLCSSVANFSAAPCCETAVITMSRSPLSSSVANCRAVPQRGISFMLPVADMGDRFYPVRMLGGFVLALCGCQTPAQYWIEIVHPWVQKFYPVLGQGSGERRLWHFSRLQFCTGCIPVCEKRRISKSKTHGNDNNSRQALSCNKICHFSEMNSWNLFPDPLWFRSRQYCACLPGVWHNYRAICCKMGYRTDVPV